MPLVHTAGVVACMSFAPAADVVFDVTCCCVFPYQLACQIFVRRASSASQSGGWAAYSHTYRLHGQLRLVIAEFCHAAVCFPKTVCMPKFMPHIQITTTMLV